MFTMTLQLPGRPLSERRVSAETIEELQAVLRTIPELTDRPHMISQNRRTSHLIDGSWRAEIKHPADSTGSELLTFLEKTEPCLADRLRKASTADLLPKPSAFLFAALFLRGRKDRPVEDRTAPLNSRLFAGEEELLLKAVLHCCYGGGWSKQTQDLIDQVVEIMNAAGASA